MPSTVHENKRLITAERDRHDLRVAGMPYYFHLHVFMPCNQKCIMCMPDGRHPRDVLPFADFERFVERISPYAEHLTLIGGEPLLYPWIDDALDLLARHEIEVTINTNATNLDERLCARLLRLHGIHLKCSIDAVTRETYRRIRGTDAFERVRGNLERFARLADGAPRARQILVYVVMKENLHEVLPFVEYAKQLPAYRVEFHPVRHVSSWVVENDTGWVFDGSKQSCESFRDEYNAVMRDAAARCEKEGLEHEVLFV